VDDQRRENDVLRSQPILTAADIAKTGEAQLEKQDLARDRQELIPSAPAAARAAGGAAAAAAPAREEPNAPLFPQQESEQLRVRWSKIQVDFVDEPRRSEEEADKLVAETMKRLAEIFSRERETLEKQWDRGEGTSTEDLRMALRRYRSFFGRLLSV